MASKAQANPALERRIQREIERAVEDRQQEPVRVSPSPTTQVSTPSASPSPRVFPAVQTFFDTFQSAQEVDQAAPAVPSPYSPQNHEKMYGSVLGETFTLHRISDGQLLLTVRPTPQLAGVIAGVVVIAVALTFGKKLLSRSSRSQIKRYKIKRIDL